jgi:integrase
MQGANSAAVTIIRLLTFTGARKSEIAALKWSEVDLEHGYLRLIDSKTGWKIVPLGKPARLLLSSLKPSESSSYVFPAEAGISHYQGTDKVWRKARALAKLPDVRIHDLRHTFASFAITSGSTLPFIAKILGHKDVKTTSRYAHLADDPLKKTTDTVSDTIASAMGGSIATQPVNAESTVV